MVLCISVYVTGPLGRSDWCWRWSTAVNSTHAWRDLPSSRSYRTDTSYTFTSFIPSAVLNLAYSALLGTWEKMHSDSAYVIESHLSCSYFHMFLFICLFFSTVSVSSHNNSAIQVWVLPLFYICRNQGSEIEVTRSTSQPVALGLEHRSVRFQSSALKQKSIYF